MSTGVVLLMLFCYGSVSDILLKPLEDKYPPISDVNNITDVKWVVVLGGGHTSDPALPVTGRISNTTLARLVEGIRIHNKLQKSKLILSGGDVFDPMSDAGLMAEVALELGVGDENLVLESVSKDTKDQAMFIRKIVNGDRFVLISTAFHMPRSMALFQKLGMQPIPAPTDHCVKKRQGISPDMFFPDADNLYKVQKAFHEYLGLVWAKLRGQI